MRKKIRILMDLHMNKSRESGNARYSFNLYKALQKNKKIHILESSIKNNFFRYVFGLSIAAYKSKCHIIHTTYFSPLFKTHKLVITVHDMSFNKYPHFFNLKDKLLFRYYFPYSLVLAGAIIVPSKFTRDELVKYFPQQRYKIFVTYEGVDPNLKKRPNEVYKKNYLLVINSDNPKKNINRVIEAWLRVRKIIPWINLIILGGDYNILPRNKNLNGCRVVKNYISDNELIAYYKFAVVFIYYSLYEGFGLPILEAIRQKTPVILSSIPSNKEVTLNKLTYADPLKSNNLAIKIIEILKNKDARKKLIKNQFQILKYYSWKKTADETVVIYKNILSK